MEKKAEKLMDVAKIGAKGQIVIPKSMRDMFGLRPGDTLLLLADESRGIAMNKITTVEDEKRFADEFRTLSKEKEK